MKNWANFPSGMLLEICQSNAFAGNSAGAFLQKAKEYLDQRKQVVSKDDLAGGLHFVFRPSQATFEGILEELTEGFFDNSDCPAPEYWIDVSPEAIYAAVPNKLAAKAYELSELSVNGALCLEVHRSS